MASTNVVVPVSSQQFLGSDGLVSKPWYQAIQLLAARANTLTAQNAAAVDLTADVRGILPVPNGGTGRSSVTAYGPLFGGTTTTGNLQSSGPGTSGQLLTSNGASAVPTFQTLTLTDCFCGVIEVPQNKDYIIGLNVPFAFTAVSMTAVSSSGTCTMLTKKNTTSVTGLSNNVSSFEDTSIATGGNSFALGDDVRLTIFSVNVCQNLAFCLKFTRTL